MIKLFCDSAANLPAETVEKYNISVVHLSYTVNGVQADTSGSFNGKAFYDGIRSGSTVKTSMVNISAFEKRFEQELESGNDILCLSISGGVSGTANAARNAAADLKEKYPDRTIVTIDTLGASLGEGLLVIEAAEMIRQGDDILTIRDHILQRIPHMCQFFTVDDLQHLHRSGRCSGGTALIGGLLGIKPLLTGDDRGKIIMYDKKRGMKATLDALADRYAMIASDFSENIGIAHADNEKGADYLLERLELAGFYGECIKVCYEPVTGSHLGPGAVALFFFGEKRLNEE